MKKSTFPRKLGGLLLALALTSAAGARAQQVAAPALQEAAAYGLLSGADLVAGTKSNPVSIRVQGQAGATGTISAGVQASGGMNDQGSGTVPNALTDLRKARAYCTALGGSSLGGQLDGQTLAAGAYAVAGNATLGAGATLTLTGDTTTVIVLNVAGSLALANQSQVVLDGVLPQHVFWNVTQRLAVASDVSFSGVALTGGSITLTGIHAGNCALLSQGGVTLTDVAVMIGHNWFYASARLTTTCTPQTCTFTPPGGELVRDGSFELYSCPPTDLGDILHTCYWHSPTKGSPDFFHADADATSHVGVPDNIAGIRHGLGNPGDTQVSIYALGQNTTAQTGQGYVGLYAYSPTTIYDQNTNITYTVNHQEYVAQEVTARLQAGHHYYAEFSARLAPASGSRVNHLAMAVAPLGYGGYTSSNPANVPGSPTLTTATYPDTELVVSGTFNPPQTPAAEELANQTGGWNRVGQVFTPGMTRSSGFTLLIGNLVDAPVSGSGPTTNPSSIPTGIGTPEEDYYGARRDMAKGAYYYIDNVTLSMVTEAGPNVTLVTTCLNGPGGTGAVLGTLPMPAMVGATYAWTSSDNSFTSAAANPTVHPRQTTTYTLTVSIPVPTAVVNGQQQTQLQSYTSTVTVTVNLVQLSPAFNWTQTGCRSITATPATAAQGATYTWSWGDGSSNPPQGSGPAPHTYAGTGTSYQVTLLVQAPGCDPVSSTQTVTLAAPPATPAFTVQAACNGLATATLNGTVVAGTTYEWNWGDTPPSTITGPGPYDHQYQASGTYTVSNTATNGTGCSTTATQQVTIQLGSCCPRNVPVANILGQPGQTTTLTGGALYGGGAYWVRGNLLLTNGTYTLTPGTIFYVDGVATRQPSTSDVDDRTVQGATITLGDGALLLVDGATITASGSTTGCPMWRGIVVEGSPPPGRPQLPSTQVTIRNGSLISHAYCALTVTRQSFASGGVPYRLTNSSFQHNLTHVLDLGNRKGGTGPALIESCTFDADPAQMRYPYNATGATDQYVTYQALQLLPDNDGNYSDAVQVTDNTISHAVYGIVNNLTGQGGDAHAILIAGNKLTDIYQTGIWAVDNHARPQGTNTVSAISSNTVRLSGFGGQPTEQLAAGATLFGLSTEDSQPGYQRSALRDNKVYGDAGSSKPQVGLSLFYQTDAGGNNLFDLTEGLRTTALDASDVSDNATYRCLSGVTVQPSGSYGYQAQLGCNSFQRAGASGVLRGIWAVDQADFNDQGTFANPAGNAFTGLDEKVRNDGTAPIKYYQTVSTQEAVSDPIIGTAGGTPITNPQFSDGYCRATSQNGNGVRGTLPGLSYMELVADSVRRQLVPRPRRRAYLGAVLHHYLDQGRAATLQTWWVTLLPGNAEDYRTTGLWLLHYYDRQPTAALAAERVLTALQGQAALDANLAAELRLRQVERHLPATAPRLAAADSVTLRAVAWSGAVGAGRAGRWLRYFHPRVALPTVPADPNPLRSAARPVAPAPSVPSSLLAQLGEAYPNPARTEVQIACQLPADAAGGGTLRFTDLVSGRTVREVPVPGGEQAQSLRVALGGLAPGAYAYRLLVAGRPVAGARKLVVIP